MNPRYIHEHAVNLLTDILRKQDAPVALIGAVIVGDFLDAAAMVRKGKIRCADEAAILEVITDLAENHPATAARSALAILVRMEGGE